MFPFFGRRRDDARRDLVARLKAEIRTHLGLGPQDDLTVSEIVCADPACPGMETVVLVMREGARTVALKIPASLDAVTPDHVAALALPPGER